jgi:hypothetical protein
LIDPQPAIVVLGYNRVNSLKRLLNAIKNSDYGRVYPTLVISIDYSTSHQQELKDIAEQLDWFGEKQIICHSKNLGLKEHIFFCADLSNTYDSVVILEDDLFVSPAFYQYAQHALRLFEKEEHIAGVALYNNSFNEAAALPFEPIKTESDFYLMQVPCSWGQLFHKTQWNDFKTWYDSEYSESQLVKLPVGIRSWSEKSWKKSFFVYLKNKQKFFVYPYGSYSMNLNEIGTNVNAKDFKFLNGLMLSSKIPPLKLISAPEYDDAYMLSSSYLNCYTNELKAYDYEVDLYGSKLNLFTDDQWLITALEVSQYEKSFGLELKPIELNIIFGIEGKAIYLTQKKHIITTRLSKSLISYYYPIPRWYAPFFEEPVLKRIVAKTGFFIKKLFSKN